MRLLIAFLRDVVVAERDRRLSQFFVQLGLLELLGGLKSHLDVAALEGEVVPLLGVLFKEKSDLAVALLLQIADD